MLVSVYNRLTTQESSATMMASFNRTEPVLGAKRDEAFYHICAVLRKTRLCPAAYLAPPAG